MTVFRTPESRKLKLVLKLIKENIPMKKLPQILSASCALLSLHFLPSSLSAQKFPDSPEMIYFQDIPPVFTASKMPQSLQRASSIVSVITDEEIERSGARTLYELLKRVPGFFPSTQATWPLVGSRGLVADGNDHILFLVDGHPQNSIVGQGYQQQDMIPALEKVKKIEIIRGPGSVLWGSNAVMGIINVITKDPADMKGHKATAAYGSADKMGSANYLYSFGRDDVSSLLSLSAWKSDGYNRPGQGGPAAFNKADALRANGNVEFPWGEVGNWPPIDRHREGYEIYSKTNFFNSRVLARIVQTNVVYPWDTWLEKGGSDLTMRKAYLEYQNNKEFSPRFNLDSTVYADLLLQNRFPNDDVLFRSTTSAPMQDQTNEELAFGGEMTAHLVPLPGNHLKIGAKAVRTKIGPNRGAYFDAFQNVAASTSLPYLGVESGYDNNIGIYFEDSHSFFDDKTTLFFGSRYDHNDFREHQGVFLPRGGVIQEVLPDLTLKYVLNTGYLRPNAVYAKTVGVIVDTTRGPNQNILRVTKSEEIISHDVQARWQSGKNYLAATWFLMQVKNYISFDANNLPQGYKNLGDANTTGVELEGRTHFLRRFSAYGNYSYAKAKLDQSAHQGALSNDQDEILNYPRHLWNAGVDWLPAPFQSVNVNMNGWARMHVVKPIEQADYAGQFGDLAGEQYVDVNYQHTRVFGLPLEISLFVTNLFDNTHAVGMIINNGLWHPRGRNLGAKIAVRW